MCNFITNKISNGISLISDGISFATTAWIPNKPWTIAAVSFAGWYGHQVALTYGPGIIAQYFINATTAYLGIGGSVIGATVVAPMLTPSLVPWAAAGASLALMYVVGIVVNVVQKYLFEKCFCSQKEETPPG